MTDARDLWKVCSDILRSQVSDATWRASFAGVEPVSLHDGELHLAVPSELVRDRLSGRYQPLLADALRDAAGGPVRAVLEVRVRPPDDPDDLPSPLLPGTPSPSPSPGQRPSLPDPSLTHRFTFDTFVIGPSNRFAHAAALSVAEAPARSYNPLFIYGGAGLGKTHLLQAIGNYVVDNFPHLHVRYVSTETFMNEFVETLRAKDDMGAFRRRYRECDVLLLDDVQFMDKKESLQEELFHTFNTLYGSSKQIVLTSDRPPKAIANLEDRLRSRLLSGLLTDIQPPELETRIAILRTKAEQQSAPVADDVLEFIATNVTDNIRELEGALIRVTAFAALNHQPLTRPTAERVLADLVAARQPRRITARQILEATAEHFGFTVEELCGPSRRRPLVVARQIGMYVFRELTDFSYPAIAREFGGRDHTTVIHAVEKISKLMKERRAIYEPVTELILKLKGGG